MRNARGAEIKIINPIKIMKLSDFRVGDVVEATNESVTFEARIACIHKELLYLKGHDLDGHRCSEHNGNWACREIDGIVRSDDSSGPFLKLISRASRFLI